MDNVVDMRYNIYEVSEMPKRKIFMENYIIATMDELGRILVPKDVRISFDWSRNTPLTIAYNIEESMAWVSNADGKMLGFPTKLDAQGRITIPKAIAQALEWKQGTQIALTPSHSGHRLALIRIKK